MEMTADLRERSHRVDHARRDVARMRARETDPAQTVDRVQSLEQSGEVARRIVWRLVMVHDLAQELDLADAGVGRMPGFCNDIGCRSHALMPSGVRDDAECAELVAAFDDG